MLVPHEGRKAQDRRPQFLCAAGCRGVNNYPYLANDKVQRARDVSKSEVRSARSIIDSTKMQRTV